MIRLVVEAGDADHAYASAMRWFERERELPTARFTVGYGMRDVIEVTMDHRDARTPAVRIFQEPSDVMVIS